jgi:hypothetical protein
MVFDEVESLEDPLPARVRARSGLPALGDALAQAHGGGASAGARLDRLAFEEAWVLSLVSTMQEIVSMAREAGARKVMVASSAPPVRYPNVYGIDMPTRGELIAASKSIDEIRREIGADALIYQDIEDLKRAVRDCNPSLQRFEASCFDGVYITGDVTADYLDHVEAARSSSAATDDGPRNQLSLAIEPADA